MSVEDKFSYDKSPLEVITQTNDFYFPENVESTVGDGTVITASAITPAIKWIYEHEHKIIPHPTKLVEFCSTFIND
jgi:lecithin-cholesterol acyltransferase